MRGLGLETLANTEAEEVDANFGNEIHKGWSKLNQSYEVLYLQFTNIFYYIL